MALAGLECLEQTAGAGRASRLADRLLDRFDQCVSASVRKLEIERTLLLRLSGLLKLRAAPGASPAHLTLAADRGDEVAASALALDFDSHISNELRVRYLAEAVALGNGPAIEEMRHQGSPETPGVRLSNTYWTLIDAFGNIRLQTALRNPLFVAADWAEFASSLKIFSIAYHKCNSSNCTARPRSVECVAFIDRSMREALGFTGRVVFDESAPGGEQGLDKGLQDRAEAIAGRTLSCVPLLFSVEDTCGSPNSAQCVIRGSLLNVILPGDEIVVQYGNDAHMAMVWSIDDAKEELELLDPMSEFWRLFPPGDLDAKINIVYSSRTMVRVSSRALLKFVRSFISVRDSTERSIALRLHQFK